MPAEPSTQTSLYGFETHPDKRRTERKGMYDIKQLWQRSHEIISMALLGHKQKDIAEVLGVTAATVSNTLNGPLGKEKLDDMREDRDENAKKVARRIDELTDKAMKVYDDIFDSDTASLKLKMDAANTVALELAGHRAPTKIDSRHISTTATLQELEEFKERGRQAQIESGLTITIPEAEVDSDGE